MVNRISPRSIVAVVDKCLEEELPVFKATIQDIVDELEVCRATLTGFSSFGCTHLQHCNAG